MLSVAMVAVDLWEDQGASTQEGCRGPLGSLWRAVLLSSPWSEELESCCASTESNTAVLSALRKPRYSFCASEGAKHATQVGVTSLDLRFVTSTQTVSSAMLPSLDSAQGVVVPMKRVREVTE